MRIFPALIGSVAAEFGCRCKMSGEKKYNCECSEVTTGAAGNKPQPLPAEKANPLPAEKAKPLAAEKAEPLAAEKPSLVPAEQPASRCKIYLRPSPTKLVAVSLLRKPIPVNKIPCANSRRVELADSHDCERCVVFIKSNCSSVVW